MKTGKQAVIQQEKKVHEMDEMHPSIIDWVDNHENDIINKKLFKQELEMLMIKELTTLQHMRILNKVS